MNVYLNKHFEGFVAERVESGKFNNASEVIRAALRALEQREKEDEERLQALRHKLDTAMRSGPATPLTHEDYENVKRKGREIIAERARQAEAN